MNVEISESIFVIDRVSTSNSGFLLLPVSLSNDLKSRLVNSQTSKKNYLHASIFFGRGFETDPLA